MAIHVVISCSCGVGCERALLILVGVLSFGFVALSQEPTALQALAGGISPWGVTAAISRSQNRKTKVPRARTRKPENALKSDEKQMTGKKKSNSQHAAPPQKGRKSVVESGEDSTGSGVALPQKTIGEETRPSEKPTDRDKLLDEVNLPVPVPPGEVRGSRPSSTDRPGMTERSSCKASKLSKQVRKPPKRKHEKQTHTPRND